MISKTVNDALNKQVNAEMFSSYLYLSMSAWCSERSLVGFVSWMRVQAKEELFHATKIFDYILERGGSIELETIEKPAATWDTALEISKEVANHEAKVTALINDLVDVAIQEKDHAANNFLQWFIAEQVEEEASVGEVLERMKMIGDDSAGMFVMDMELGKRVFVEPAE